MKSGNIPKARNTLEAALKRIFPTDLKDSSLDQYATFMGLDAAKVITPELQKVRESIYVWMCFLLYHMLDENSKWKLQSLVDYIKAAASFVKGGDTQNILYLG